MSIWRQVAHYREAAQKTEDEENDALEKKCFPHLSDSRGLDIQGKGD